MFIQASQMIGHRLVALETRQLIGKIERPVFDTTHGRLLALLVRSHGWFGKKKVLAATDIIGVEPGFVLTRKAIDLVEVKEIVRIEELIKAKMPILGQHAITESGQKLGDVTDVLVDTEAWLISKYYLRNLLMERIFLAEDVQSITKKGVIFFDRVTGPRAVSSQAETAAV